MKRLIITLAVVAIAVLAGTVRHVTAARADLADRCRVQAVSLSPTGTNPPIIRVKVYDCPTTSFPYQVKASCQVQGLSISSPWSQCANTIVREVDNNGNESWSVSLGNGSWGCNAFHYWRGLARIYDADTNTWVANASGSFSC